MEPTHRIFLYNACAHALSGEFQRPVKYQLEVQAATSLPTAGGHANSRVDNFRVNELVSFRAAYTHVSGSWDAANESHTTQATATIEGLNILDVVTADRVVARVSGHHKEPDDEAHIIFLGSKFENLRIAGCKVEVEFHQELFQNLGTFKALKNEFATNAEFRRMSEDPFHTGKPQKAPEGCGVFLCSFVKDMTACPGIKRQGHAYLVPKFGKVFIGEVAAQHSIRTLTMLRLELGSPAGGSFIAVQAMTNGVPWP